ILLQLRDHTVNLRPVVVPLVPVLANFRGQSATGFPLAAYAHEFVLDLAALLPLRTVAGDDDRVVIAFLPFGPSLFLPPPPIQLWLLLERPGSRVGKLHRKHDVRARDPELLARLFLQRCE